MTEQTPATAELPPPPTSPTPPVPPISPPAPPTAEPRTRWRDRSLRLPLASAVAVVCLLVGGGVGALIGYVAHADAPQGPGRTGFDRPDGFGGFGGPGGPGGAPPEGQQAPGTSS